MQTTFAPHSSYELPTWLWLWLPLALLGGVLAPIFLDQDDYMRIVFSELGILENLTVAFLLVAVVAGARLLLRRDFPDRWLGLWVAQLTLGCVYFAGEEASWGQHWIGWATPEGWASLNDQQETNIHNMTGIGLFDQVPRLVLAIGALVGGVIVPFLRRRDPHSAAKFWSVPGWYWGTLVCAPAVILALGIRLPVKLLGNLGVELPHIFRISPGEYKELYLAMFLMIYLLSLSRRMKMWQSQAGGGARQDEGRSPSLFSSKRAA